MQNKTHQQPQLQQDTADTVEENTTNPDTAIDQDIAADHQVGPAAGTGHTIGIQEDKEGAPHHTPSIPSQLHKITQHLTA